MPTDGAEVADAPAVPGMPAERPGQRGRILVALDALVVQRADQPSATDEAPVALRRIGWIGRPIILVGSRSRAGTPR